MPDISEFRGLAGDALVASKFSLGLPGGFSTALQEAMEQMRSPWLNMEHVLDSARGFAELQAVGASINAFAAFDDTVVLRLRTVLGDWRDAMPVLPSIADDLVARTTFYRERGVDPNLTDFPASAFDEGTVIARLKEPAPMLVEIYDFSIPARNEEEEGGFRRTNAAHDRLLRFETQLRRFIDEQMTAAFGGQWVKQRVPAPIRASWAEKSEAAAKSGGAKRPLISYADFTDYEAIICRNDNWNEVFRAVFVRQEAVRESLLRLYPVRLATMHARLITQEDQLLLYIETKRILKAMGFQGVAKIKK